MKPDYDENIRHKLPLNRKHKVGVSVFKFDELNRMISTDLPGRFPIKSARGNSYILVMYCYTNNAILAEPIQSRLATDIEKGYNKLYKKLLLSGIIPVLQQMDNETSKELISTINDKNLSYQVASPGDHRLLPVERAIQTFKNHFISILYGADRTFPANQWDRLLPQTVMTLNMVRRSRINPRLSAYQQIWGNYDFAKHPMGIAGCKTITHL